MVFVEGAGHVLLFDRVGEQHAAPGTTHHAERTLFQIGFTALRAADRTTPPKAAGFRVGDVHGKVSTFNDRHIS